MSVSQYLENIKKIQKKNDFSIHKNESHLKPLKKLDNQNGKLI